MKSRLTTLAGSLGVIGGLLAANPAAAEVTGNVALVTDYFFRGITQTAGAPAIQGGFDYAHESGAYVGTWASSVTDWASDASLELDIYGGYKFSPVKDLSLDVGLLRYAYPNSSYDPALDTTEVYVGATYGMFGFKYSYTNDFFGTDKSASYPDLSATIALPMDLSLGLHVGWNMGDGVKLLLGDEYVDYKIALSATYAKFGFELAYVGNDLDEAVCPSAGVGTDCDGAVTLKVSRSF